MSLLALGLNHACRPWGALEGWSGHVHRPSPSRPAAHAELETVLWEDAHWAPPEGLPVFKTATRKPVAPSLPACSDTCGCALGFPSLLIPTATWSLGPQVWLGRMLDLFKQKHDTQLAPKQKATHRTNNPLVFKYICSVKLVNAHPQDQANNSWSLSPSEQSSVMSPKSTDKVKMGPA